MNKPQNVSDGNNQDHPRKDQTNRILGLFTLAAAIAWFLGASTNGVFNFFSDSPGFQLYPFCFALWSALWLVAIRRVVHHNDPPWVFMVCSLVCVVILVITTQAVERKEARIKLAIKTSIPSLPDYFPGTQITRSRLREVFPFGYAVIFFGKSERERWEVWRTGKLEWKIDLDNIIIDPHPETDTVSWVIPPISAIGTNYHGEFHGVNLYVTSHFTPGSMENSGFVIADAPNIYVAVLGNNQRTPVFAIGFRIPSQNDSDHMPE